MTARITVTGAGMIGRTHVEALGRVPEARGAGIAETAPAGKAMAAELGVAHFTDHAAMFDAVKPDGAIIASPNALHVAMGLDCVQRRIPMLVEKPIAPTVADAARLVAAATGAGVAVLVGRPRPHNPIIATARAAVRAGRIGRGIAVTALSLFKKPDGHFDMALRREPA